MQLHNLSEHRSHSNNIALFYLANDFMKFVIRRLVKLIDFIASAE